ncbi:MAG: tripartite tricarboxylate transporter substrate binding protein [Reyranella sp.]|uniref:Bug family tripartite tricarboxylate transporter substrate binding protein n=1 Tax=Reyranella sp. TaxID=1929291 RepID=UPI001AD4DDE1|nr:tripartite tricarboxylate transporter substrate-binding protein [Reyranella sp.]MBN9085520.1 tripartite tricarboxylate transporter substrate binding protein [Reyranella sp.]
MTLTRRLFLAATGVAATNAARAAGYPSDTIRVVVPRAPGGGTDNLIRLMQPGLEKKLGVSILIENKPDASAVVGAQIVSKAKPDGNTVLLADNALYQNPAILESLPYDTLKDFSAVTMVAQGPVILIVHPDVPAKDLKELIALAKTKELSFASGGIGASTHLVGVMVDLKAGVKILHVPFKGSGPALNALLGGHVTMQYGGINSAAPYVKSGKVRAIAVTGAHRDPSLPDVPTFTEAGLAGADVTSVWGMHAPLNTPIEIRRVLRDAIAEVLRDPALATKLAEFGYEPIANTPEQHQAQTVALVNQWIEVGKTVNLKE